MKLIKRVFAGEARNSEYTKCENLKEPSFKRQVNVSELDFGLDKCTKIHLKKGKIVGVPKDPELVDISVIRHLNTGETYTYLRVPQSLRT